MKGRGLFLLIAFAARLSAGKNHRDHITNSHVFYIMGCKSDPGFRTHRLSSTGALTLGEGRNNFLNVCLLDHVNQSVCSPLQKLHNHVRK
jgi:hypothetical protein